MISVLCSLGLHDWCDGGWVSTQFAVIMRRYREGARRDALYEGPYPKVACARCGKAKDHA